MAIDLFPRVLLLRPGEQLRLILSGQHRLGGVVLGIDDVPLRTRTGTSFMRAGKTPSNFSFS